ncbi:MAG: methylcobalamin:coenzyme M methyltransferase [Planctomycetes bacterium ADurb.Bin401]|nr:MAG: methylcobalamin:coenzyme M methyltransferase [Planctomycetes bacterium ADurb.Bin401]
MSSIQGRVSLSSFWMQEEFGISEPNPFEMSLDNVVEHEAKKAKLLYEKFGQFGMGQKEPEMIYPALQHDGRNVCAYAYGSPYPTWDPKTGSFWHNRDFIPWPNLRTIQDVKKIKMPDWTKVYMVQEMLAKFEEMKKQTKYIIPKTPSLPWNKFGFTSPSGKNYEFAHFMSFLDLGCFMCGEAEFFTILGGEEEIASALMDKCFELSTSYSEFMLKAYGQPSVTGISSFGGDNSCMLSPEMYKKYAIAYDRKIIEKYGDLPANLHSCGASAHLYEVWNEYPNLKNIVLMQTRGIPNELNRLRKALPYTFLEITLHQPQFDFENETPENIENIIEHYIEQADGRDIALVVVINRAGKQVDKNIEIFYKAMLRYE